jgi:hypothetical protein
METKIRAVVIVFLSILLGCVTLYRIHQYSELLKVRKLVSSEVYVDQFTVVTDSNGNKSFIIDIDACSKHGTKSIVILGVQYFAAYNRKLNKEEIEKVADSLAYQHDIDWSTKDKWGAKNDNKN